MTTPRPPRCYALIPAAGSGTRMGLAQPKQYARVAGRTVLDWTLDAFRACARIEATFVVLASADRVFVSGDESVVPLYCGGASRRDSVLAGLEAVADRVRPDDWVLVHDAARPGITAELLAQLIAECERDPVGGLLAVPVADTLKRAADAPDAERAGVRVAATVARAGLWAAQTPQMFRHDLLVRALRTTPDATDEASAVEALGLAPRLVHGSARNFKLTYRDDLAIAEALLLAQRPGARHERHRR